MNRALLVLCACVLFPDVVLARPVTWKDLAPRASGIFLAEVTAVRQHDDRPVDGNLVEISDLKIIRATGQPLREVGAFIADAGMRLEVPPDLPTPPPPKFMMKAGDLVVGKRYWFATASTRDPAAYPDRVSGWWPVDDSIAAPAFDAAIRDNVLRWSPTYEPGSGLTYGLLANPSGGTWRTRVWNDHDVLWEREFRGQHVKEWNLVPADVYPDSCLPPHTKMNTLLLQVANFEVIPEKNEWQIPAGAYDIVYLLEAQTGRKLATLVRSPIRLFCVHTYDSHGKIVSGFFGPAPKP
ncbi:MAG TPA: hypothetical protein VGR66_00945 [Candidatus Eisenbacteria bacterium]|jgi:hypothetical protein|nr:hypothetical protein [Candidatus Eisenbacteria bacterium]